MILQAKNLFKAFQSPQAVRVLQGVSLDVAPGTSIAITGRSGEGKTTLLHILGTLESADQGSLWICGQKVSKHRAISLRSQHIGFVFQTFNLLEDFTALENALMPARIARRSVSRKEGLDLLSQVGLVDRAHFPAKLLSGGEKQRVAIARALCNDPDLILADEPSGNLDAANADLIRSLLFSLVQKKKKSLILATHDDSLAQCCAQKYLLSQGKLSAQFS